MIHSSYKEEKSDISKGNDEGSQSDDDHKNNISAKSKNVVQGMIPFGIPARPQKEIAEEINLLKQQEQNKGKVHTPRSRSDSY